MNLLRQKSQSRAFTLVELLVVVAVIGILATLLFPVLRRAQESSQRAACTALQGRMTAAAILHAVDHGYYPSSVVGKSLWPQVLTDYMGVANTPENRATLYECPKKSADGLKEYIAHNMWMGYNENESNASAKRYIHIRLGSVPTPSKTSIFTCGFNRQPGNNSMKHYYYRFGKATGSDSVNWDKFGGGAIWSFVDGHAEWLSAEDVAERSGKSGQGSPFIKPF